MEGIEFRDVSFHYPNGFLANEGLNLKVHPGERVAIIGQNGAGKSTAAKMMHGLYKPTQGSVFVNGINTRGKTTAQIARMVGYVFQNPDEQIFNSTVIKEIEYMPRYFRLPEEEIKARTEEVLSLTGLEHCRDMNPFDISYSTRKFVTIAAVLATKPLYTIWDEPTAGQDCRHTVILRKILDYLKDQRVGVVVITHDMDFVVNTFDRIVVMANKHIIADGTPKEIFSREEIIRESCISRPQVGNIAHQAGIEQTILFRQELVAYLSDWESRRKE